MMLTILRPLLTSELLDRTFHLYKNDFLIFFAIVAIPQLTIALTLLYYDERVRKEGFDLQWMMSNLEGAAPAGAGVAAP
jgi:hypothetical protein